MEDQIGKIEQIARDVYNTLGSGFEEKVYDRAMQVGLRLAKIPYDSQKVVEVTYKDHYVGEGKPDLLVRLKDGRVVVELKAIPGILGPPEVQQLRNYMRILNVDRGLLVNFQQPGKTKKERTTELETRSVAI